MKLTIISPSRIHLGLIDLNGSIGRVDGGMGITLDYPNFIIEGRESPDIEIEFDKNLNTHSTNNNHFNSAIDKNELKKRIQEVSKNILNYIGEKGIYLNIKSIIPQHSGLGSGTQIALSTGKLISLIYNKELDGKTLSNITGRGGTSGIGVNAFEKGGFIIDGGHTFGKGKDKEEFRPSSASKNVRVPPILFRHDFNWDIVLTIPKGNSIYGNKEVDIFKKYCPIPLNETQKMCHLILMKMMPAIIENDIKSFGEVVNELQYMGFKKVEVGLQKDIVKKLLGALQKISYSGLSSFGPTIYSICDGKEDIQKVVETSQEFFDKNGIDGNIIITKGNNKGFKIIKN
ncbi:beta-ribofuranosylaminobenzene 5'-phosphate synthase [Methanothermococcus sp.]|uniref:beta-ribofuranosylaminobenzene 5'-phosphate synthase n=1 Tax=Methanothermococcus sp. TaxID=2614238 RepID=UPI0025EDBA8A|nr:beta-ribofuranosylaminobenzene 5'-phosphate synthase [Methanothermococcus sp.]